MEDLSSPDLLHQRNHVKATLESLSNRVSASDIMEKVITVGNKCDLIEKPEAEKGTLCVSAKTGLGLLKLADLIEEAIITNTKRCVTTLRVPIGGDEVRWLYKNAVIIDTKTDNDQECQETKVIIAPGKLEQFKHYFVKRQIR